MASARIKRLERLAMLAAEDAQHHFQEGMRKLLLANQLINKIDEGGGNPQPSKPTGASSTDCDA
jgi:hypothetical protein